MRFRAALWAQVLPVAGGDELQRWAREATADLARTPAASPWIAPIARALAIAWPRLAADERRRLASIKPLQQALAEFGADVERASAEPPLLAGLAVAAAAVPAPPLIALLPRALGGAASGKAACESLFSLARAWEALSPQSRSALDAAIVDSASQDAVLADGAPLLAALIPPRVETPAIAGWLESGDEASLMALRSAVRRLGGSAAGQRWALRLVRETAVARAAVEAVAAPPRAGAPAGNDDRAHLLPDWHLLLAPARRVRMRDAGSRICRAWLGRSGRAALTFQAGGPSANASARAIAACAWAALLAPTLERRSFFADALTAGEPLVRHAAVRALLSSVGAEPPEPALDDFAFDADPHVARAALLGLRARDRMRFERLRRKLTRSPQEPTRRLAASLGALAPSRWRDAISAGAGGGRDWLAPASLRMELARDRASALAALRAAAGSGQAASRIVAIRLAARAGVVSEVELELLRLLATPVQAPEDARLAATAIGALGRLRTHAAREALTRFAAHPDDRIRATALEALGRQGAEIERLRAALRDEAPRARANAVASLIELAPRDDAPRAALVEMLASSDAERGLQRSALWVVEQRGLAQHASQVAEIASDTAADGALRDRARRCARRLLARLSSPPDSHNAAQAEVERP